VGEAAVKRLAATLVMLVAAPAAAQEGPRFCPNRPSLDTSTCTTDPGRVLAEVSGIDWQRDDTDGTRQDTLLFGDAQLRTGIDSQTEVQIGWTPLAQVRTHASDGSVDTVTGVGDVRLGLRRNLHNPDGSGTSLALEGFVTLPTGRHDIGAGDWSAGALLPVSVALGDWSLQFTGELDAEPDEMRDGHHAAGSATFGVGRKLGDKLTAVVEMAAQRDDDPDAASTQWVGAASLAWAVRDTAQLDVLFVAGLNHDAPDLRAVLGGAILF
jgi:hypothetical protein